MSAVAGLERLESTAAEGSSRTTLNFAWGTDLNEAADDVRNRLDPRARPPAWEADAPVMFKFDYNAMPIMGVGVEEDLDLITLRELAEHDLSPRLERVPGVAAVTIEGASAGRSIGALQGEGPGARSCRSTASSGSCGRRTRTSPSARSTKETRRIWCAAGASSRTSMKSARWW